MIYGMLVIFIKVDDLIWTPHILKDAKLRGQEMKVPLNLYLKAQTQVDTPPSPNSKIAPNRVTS